MATKPMLPIFRVLFVDGYLKRANSYRVHSSEKQPFEMRIAISPYDFENALKERYWDLVITSGGYLGRWHSAGQANSLVDSLIEAFYTNRIGGVVINATEVAHGREIAKQLLDCLVPTKWFPYNYGNPSMHVERSI